MHRLFRHSALVTALLPLTATPAAAQLEEVIVTAQKRTESVQDVVCRPL